jgi:tRNA dimethylallyltransferase
MKNNSQISVPSTVYIVGPTASGKSALAMAMAEELGHAEIVCADSQTVRKHMDIGTAKPTLADRARVRHHCLDLIEPYEAFSLHAYLEHARKAIADIHRRGAVAIVVGGTGLYVDALYFDFTLPKLTGLTPTDNEQYEKLEVDALQKMIIDRALELPENTQNKRHLVNKLLRDGQNGMRSLPDASSCIVGLAPEREVLKERLLERTESMFAMGFVAEVQGILATYGRPPKTFDAIAYKIIMRLLDGEMAEQQAKEAIHIAERQYAKRQMTWFKRNKDIVWFTEAESAKAYLHSICRQ